MKRSRWSSASFNSLKALELSMPPMKPSKRSTKRGSWGVFLANGLISSGYSVMNTGWIRFGSTVSLKSASTCMPHVGSSGTVASSPSP